MNTDLALHRAHSIRVEDKIQYQSNGRSYTLRSYTIQGADGAYSIINVFAEDGSALDLEIRANVAAQAERLTCSTCDGSGVVDVEPATARLLMGSACDDCEGSGRVTV